MKLFIDAKVFITRLPSFINSKNYCSLTRETKLKVAVKMENLTCLLVTVRTLKVLKNNTISQNYDLIWFSLFKHVVSKLSKKILYPLQVQIQCQSSNSKISLDVNISIHLPTGDISDSNSFELHVKTSEIYQHYIYNIEVLRYAQVFLNT